MAGTEYYLYIIWYTTNKTIVGQIDCEGRLPINRANTQTHMAGRRGEVNTTRQVPNSIMAFTPNPANPGASNNIRGGWLDFRRGNWTQKLIGFRLVPLKNQSKRIFSTQWRVVFLCKNEAGLS